MDFKVSSLVDVHDHSLAVSGWEQVYRQMTPGRFESKVVEATSSAFHFFRESTNRRIVQAGVSPAGYASIAVPLSAPLAGTFQGQRINGFALMLLSPGEEFRFYTPEAMHYAGVSLPVEQMNELVAVTVGDDVARQWKRNVLPVSDDAAQVLQQRLVPVLDAAEANPAALTHPASVKLFQDEVLGVLLGLLESASGVSKRDLTHATYSDIVRRCERIASENAPEPVTALDLCRALRCSRRTLQTSFQRVANVTPVEYLRAMRLNAVRRLLRSTSAEELLIGDAAARYGFSHLSYFAREYRDLFGELPSQTQRRF
ncbi:transcriptional regulator, AraC family [Burkholderia sp. lig30]|jgi:AraC-like DNA-binding protein|uniref:helix-turn-helix domain-containing protein n=1 Tax=Burkholderia sp. lig30 TaxID=1192124 RepID=UPI000460E499|nr:helix-turn-helix domain-containing protein [Burkholderia sp. lig30]KDB06386.1 transcriptional regulator, AraC family [Burkholderia sp. lig30]